MDKVFYDKCKDRLYRISNSMLRTNQSFCVIVQLHNYQKEHNELINISPAFYTCVTDCCMESLFVETDIMFDPKTDREGIRGLLLKMKNNIDLLDNDRSIEANETTALDNHNMTTKKYDNIVQLIGHSIYKINDNKEIIKNVKTLRDKYFAHRESKVNYDKLFKNNPVSMTDIEKLLVLNTNIVNALYMYFFDRTLFPIAQNHDDFNRTVFYINKGVKGIREKEG